MPPQPRKKEATYPIFLSLADKTQDPTVKSRMVDWAYNRFTKDIRYANGILIAKGKSVKSYDLTTMSPEESLEVVMHVLQECVWKKPRKMDTRESKVSSKPPTPNEFGSLHHMIKNCLIKQFVNRNETVPAHRKAEYRDAIRAGILIKSIVPKQHIRMRDGEIVSIEGIEYDPTFDTIRLLSIDSVCIPSSVRSSMRSSICPSDADD